MPTARRRSARLLGSLTAAAAIGTLVNLSVAPAGAVSGTPSADGSYAYTARIAVGDNFRTCTGALVDRSWVVTAASCFTDDPAQPATVVAGAPKWRTTVTLGRTDLAATGQGVTVEVGELLPDPGRTRDLVLARLATPVDGIAPVRVASTAPAAGQQLRVPGYGRTKTEWSPLRLHSGLFRVDAVRPTGLDTTGLAGAAVCKGDTGAPVLRETAGGAVELVAVASRSWQGGCFGSTETRTGAVDSRVDDLAGWIEQVRLATPGWKTRALVRGGADLYQATRFQDGAWTSYENVQAKAGDIGGVRTSAVAGINGDTHVLAQGANGHLYHTVRSANGTWAGFGDLNTNVGDLGGITRVAAASIGADLHVVVLADGQLFHSVRDAAGHWTGFGRVFDATGPLSGITSLAVASTGSELQVAAVSGGKVYHTKRVADGNWGAWGAVEAAAGATGPVSEVAMARQGEDVNLAVVTDNGAGVQHTIRFADGTWQPFRSLNGILGQVTVTGISAAGVDSEVRFAVDTADNRVLTVARLAGGGWSAPQALATESLPGSHTGTALTGTL
ncbi:trypsin-like serine protease [Kitasatospora sp. NPDC057692]|uniref:trypsin-like serine protease n=1 Tax=Kitasatospora sp. NPDC057692 TaxID=3346215 RepID=UPI003683205D